MPRRAAFRNLWKFPIKVYEGISEVVLEQRLVEIYEALEFREKSMAEPSQEYLKNASEKFLRECQ